MCLAGLLSLPVELLEAIAWHIHGDDPRYVMSVVDKEQNKLNCWSNFSASRRDLSAYTKTCRAVRAAAEKVLYRSIEVMMRKYTWTCTAPPPRKYDRLLIYRPISRSDEDEKATLPSHVAIGGDLHLLLRTLRQRPDLAAAIRLAAIQVPQYVRPKDLVHSDIFACAIQLLSLCDNLVGLYTPYVPPTSITSFGISRHLGRPNQQEEEEEWLPYVSGHFDNMSWVRQHLLQLRFSLGSKARASFRATKRVELSGKTWARGPVRFVWQALAECADFAEELHVSHVGRIVEAPEAWLAVTPSLPGGTKLRKLILEETEFLSLPPNTGSWFLRDLPALEVVECRRNKLLEPFSFLLLPPTVRQIIFINDLPHDRFPSPIATALFNAIGMRIPQIEKIEVTSNLPDTTYARFAEKCEEIGLPFEATYTTCSGPPYMEKFMVHLRPVLPDYFSPPTTPPLRPSAITLYFRKRYGLL